MSFVQLPIVGRREAASETFEVSFGLKDMPFLFQPGQYVRIILPRLLHEDERGSSRDFSLVSSPNNPEVLSIVFRDTGSGFKRSLLELPLGSTVSIRGPYGLFEFPEKRDNSSLVFIAGGTGIAPCLSMLRFATENKLPFRITLIYVNKNKESALYLDEIDRLEKTNDHLTVITHFGYLDRGTVQEHAPLIAESSWYLAGPSGMVSAARSILYELGVAEEKIFSEEMTGYDRYPDYMATLSEPKTAKSEEKIVAPLESDPVQGRDKPLIEKIMLSSIPSLKEENIPPKTMGCVGDFVFDIQKLTSVIETSFDGIIITDSEGIIVYANPAWQALTGWTCDEVVNKVTPRILKSGNTSPEEYAKLWKTIKSGKIAHLDVVNKKKNGELYYAEDIILPLKDAEGNVTEFVGFQRDKTEQKLYIDRLESRTRDVEMANMKIEQEKAKADSILRFLKSIGDSVFAVDTTGRIIFMNHAAEELCGYSFEESKDRHYGQIFQFALEKNPMALYPAFIEEVIRTGAKRQLMDHTGLSRRDGTRVSVSDSASPIMDENGVVIGCIVVLQDITRERALNQSKDSFLSVAAHQLRTPLGSMRWNMEMLLAGDVGDFPETAKEVVQNIYASSQRLVTLVNDLLNVSKIEQGDMQEKKESVNIADTAKEVIASLDSDAKKHAVEVSLNNLFVTKLPVAVVAPKRLYEALQNLLANAIKYNRRGGKVIVTVKEVGDRIEISIEDTGIGIPENEQGKVFSRFFRATNAVLAETEGTGLGLFVVQSFVVENHGSIRFESRENEGTTFFIDLPLAGKSVRQDVTVDDVVGSIDKK